MTFSQVARGIKESATLKLNEEAGKLRARGEAVIHLGGGQPINPAPNSAILAASAKLSSGQVKYGPTDGQPSLKKAIIRYTEEHYGWGIEPDNVIVSAGAKQAVFNVLYALVDPQDEVILLAPYWVSYPEMVRMVHGNPVVVTPEDGGFVPRMEEIEEAVSSYTKAIIVNSPNNPTGMLYPKALIASLVEFCESKGIYLIMDDIYHQLVFDSQKAPTAYDFTDRDIESTHIIVINGVSKLYGMTGFRIGWTVAGKELVGVLTNIQSQTTSCADVVAQAAAEGALTGVQNAVESLRVSLQNNRDVMLDELSALEGVKTRTPDGTFYCLPDFSAYNKNSIELSTFLLEKALIVAVPGAPFGMEGHLRMSYTAGPKELKEAVKRIKWALDPNAPNEIQIGNRKMTRDWL